MRLFLAIQLSPAVREALLTAPGRPAPPGQGLFPAAGEPAPDPGLPGGGRGPGQGPGRPVGGILPTFLLGGGRPAGAFRRPVVGRCSSRSSPGGAGRVPAGGPSLPGLLPGGPPLLPHITLVRRWRGEVPQVTVPHASMVVRQISLLRSDQIDGKRIYTELSHKSLR